MTVTQGGAPDALQELERRVASAQQLANMGDYDWHIPSDTNRWSDQLFRIFGYEPQCQNMNYETYMAHVHPDDQEQLRALHTHSFTSGHPFEVVHRIIRRDGEVRYLACNGETVTENGEVVMLRGTAIDITERVNAEQGAREHAARFAEAQLRRQKAAEINDVVIQGITAALYAKELGDDNRCREYLHRTLTAARGILDDLTGPLDRDLAPGDLIRERPAILHEDEWRDKSE